MLQKIKERILAGGEITPDEALELAQKAIHSDLYTAADEIRKKFCNKTLDTCSIINARSGHCPENCKWCAQSAHHHTQIETYDAIPIHEAISIARLNEQQGIKRLSLVTSGRRIKASEIDYFCDIYRKMGEETHLHLCASMGLLKREELEKLKAAGVKRYHCNLETASSYFSELCTTHTIEQKKETIRTAQKLGMEICSGGIIGMGENMKQRIELAFELKELGVCSVESHTGNTSGTYAPHQRRGDFSYNRNFQIHTATDVHSICRRAGEVIQRNTKASTIGRSKRTIDGRHAHNAGIGSKRRQIISPRSGIRSSII